MIVNFAHNPGSHWLLHSCECSGQNPAILWGELDAVCQYHGPSVVTAQGVLLNTSLWCKAFCSRWHSYLVPINGFLVPFIWEILGKEWHIAVTSGAGKSRGWSWSSLLLEPWSLGQNLAFWTTWVAGVESKSTPHPFCSPFPIAILYKHWPWHRAVLWWMNKYKKSPPEWPCSPSHGVRCHF